MNFSDIEVGMHFHDKYRPLVLGAVISKTDHRVKINYMSGVGIPYIKTYGCRTCKNLVKE